MFVAGQALWKRVSYGTVHAQVKASPSMQSCVRETGLGALLLSLSPLMIAAGTCGRSDVNIEDLDAHVLGIEVKQNAIGPDTTA